MRGWEVESEWLAALDGSVTYDVCYAVSVGSIVSTHDKTHSVYRCLVRQLGLERWRHAIKQFQGEIHVCCLMKDLNCDVTAGDIFVCFFGTYLDLLRTLTVRALEQAGWTC